MERKLTAILSADVQGYSRLMGQDEEATIRTLTAYRAVMTTWIQQHRGRVVDSPGDNLLAEFASVVDAVRCAVAIQGELKGRNAALPAQRRMEFRFGINLGDVVMAGDRIYGDGVNIAARLESLAEPGGLCLSGTVYDQIENKLPLTYEYLGEQPVKNITKPVRVYRVAMDEAAAAVVRQSTRPPQPEGQADEGRGGFQPVPPASSAGQRKRGKGTARLPRSATLAALSVVLLVGLVVWVHYRSVRLPAPSATIPPSLSAALPLPDKPSLIVLPFVNMSKDAEQEYFSDGLTETLTGDLSKISSLFVIARNSAFTYKGKAVKVQDVGREMGVRYVVEGSVQKADRRIRITAQLIEAATGYHLWAEQYDRPLQDIFALQDEIVQKIVTTLKLQLSLEEQGIIVRKHSDNLEAYDAFLRGVEFFNRFTKEANAQARQMYEKALALDPTYAEADAWLGLTYHSEWLWRWNADSQTLEHAFALAQKAIALDDSLPIAHTLLSVVYVQQQQYDQALAEGERAIALAPSNADSYAGQAEALNFAGRPEEALRVIEQAMRLNPRSPYWYLNDLGWSYELTGRYAEAIATLKELISRNPNFTSAYLHLAASYRLQWISQQSPATETLEPAVTTMQRALALNDSWHRNHILMGYISLYQQQYEQALAEMKRAVVLAPTFAEGYAALAEVLACMGRMEEALEAAAQALHLKPYIVDDHLAHVGTAYAVVGHYEEARAALERYLSRYPNFLPAHLMLAAVYRELGQAAEARAEAAEVLRLNPNFSLEVHRKRAPIKDPAVLERHLAALRKAGLK
jgi:adenylate cyclase